MSTPDTIPLDQLLKENKISQRTFDKATIAKSYIERKYNLKNTKNMEWNAIMRKIDSLKLSDIEKEKIKLRGTSYEEDNSYSPCLCYLLFFGRV
jgi:hypothetical protein